MHDFFVFPDPITLKTIEKKRGDQAETIDFSPLDPLCKIGEKGAFSFRNYDSTKSNFSDIFHDLPSFHL